eukprot:524535-Hanusia_phi.AAC.1
MTVKQTDQSRYLLQGLAGYGNGCKHLLPHLSAWTVAKSPCGACPRLNDWEPGPGDRNVCP